jgi:hypothetical protein
MPAFARDQLPVCLPEQLAGSGLLGAPAGEERRHLGLQEFEERE